MMKPSAKPSTKAGRVVVMVQAIDDDIEVTRKVFVPAKAPAPFPKIRAALKKFARPAAKKFNAPLACKSPV